MTFLGFESKMDCEQAIWRLLADTPFDLPSQHPLLERLFLEADWCQRSIEVLQSTGEKTWFLRVQNLSAEDHHGQDREIGPGPHLFIFYPLDAYREMGSPVYVAASDNAKIAPGWVLRPWQDCFRAKTTRRFAAKFRIDLHRWCQDRLTAHYRLHPNCEEDGCGRPAERVWLLWPSLREVADTLLQRARAHFGDATIPVPWFTQSQHFWPDYPQGFREDSQAECARSQLRALCQECSRKRSLFRASFQTQIAQQVGEEVEFERFMKERLRLLKARQGRPAMPS